MWFYLALGTSKRISATTVLHLNTLSVRSLVSGWTVIKEIAVSPTPNRTFRALTEPDQLNAWFTQDAKVNLRVGGNYSNQDGDRGKFLDIVPNKRLRFTWDNPSYGTDSIVEILLKRVRGRTVVTLIHSGLRRERISKNTRRRRQGGIGPLKT